MEWTEVAPQAPWEAPVRSVARFSLDIEGQAPDSYRKAAQGAVAALCRRGRGEGEWRWKTVAARKSGGFSQGWDR
ncbi:hypothetical protein CRPA23_11250 [Pseudomonas aeruginosa]